MTDLSMFVSEDDVRSFPSGHRFFSAGDTGDLMWVVVEGSVRVSLRDRTLEDVGPGGMVGEMALIDHHERSADVTAVTAVRAAPLDQKRFLYLIRNHPFFAIEVMKVMVSRLRHFNDLL